MKNEYEVKTNYAHYSKPNTDLDKIIDGELYHAAIDCAVPWHKPGENPRSYPVVFYAQRAEEIEWYVQVGTPDSMWDRYKVKAT